MNFTAFFVTQQKTTTIDQQKNFEEKKTYF